MPLPGLFFVDSQPLEAAITSRADVTLFVGLVKRRDGNLPQAVKEAVARMGWTKPLRAQAEIEALLDVPVPMESFEQFDLLFATDERLVAKEETSLLPTTLGLAVKSFFAEGGRKCYVVRCGDPPPLMSGIAEGRSARRNLIDWTSTTASNDGLARAPLVPGWDIANSIPTADDRKTWHGIAHLYGLEDVAMVSIPDLPDLLAVEPEVLPDWPEPKPPPEIFKPCADAQPTTSQPANRPRLAAARLDEGGFADWTRAVNTIVSFLKVARGGMHRRDVTLIAALPLPARGEGGLQADAEGDPAGFLAGLTHRADGRLVPTAFLQLVYPWMRTEASAGMPEGVENPEGIFSGVLARNALSRGAFRSAAALPLPSVRDVLPVLERAQVEKATANFADWIGDRVSLIGRAVTGFQLLSDATMSDDKAYRAGGVSRLMCIIIRAGRIEGQELVFENSVEATWTRLRRRLEEFLTELWRLGALNGASPHDAFQVRCGRATMTQADIDAGRLIAEIVVVAAQPIERITITLSLGDGDEVRRAA